MDSVKKKLIETQEEVQMISNTIKYVQETNAENNVKKEEDLKALLENKKNEYKELVSVPRVSLQVLLQAHINHRL